MTEKTILLAAPRGFCAGVVYAIDIVDLLLDRYGAPIWVRHEIVHNQHVCDRLRERGARFVDDLADVPAGSRVVFSAHGVAPAVKREAESRGLIAIDATCPLVTKVHVEVLRFAQRDFDILLVGHRGHVEVDGTFGHAPERTQIIETISDAEQVAVRDPARVGVVTQTTLSVDDTREILDVLYRRFPAIHAPSKNDICYATQNRQTSVRAIASQCELVLVVGATTSSNSNRLVDVARREGARAELISDATAIHPAWLVGVTTVGLTSGASAPEILIDAAIQRLQTLGYFGIRTVETATEKVAFPLPKELRGPRAAC